jgi:hypothetical protein
MDGFKMGESIPFFILNKFGESIVMDFEEFLHNVLKLDHHQVELLSKIGFYMWGGATVLCFLFGMIIFPEPHSIVILRLVFGILWALVPTFVVIALYFLFQLLIAAFWLSIAGLVISLILYLLTRPTPW